MLSQSHSDRREAANDTFFKDLLDRTAKYVSHRTPERKPQALNVKYQALVGIGD
jgi:hypothetical protein